MTTVLIVLNYATVFIFGLVLTAAFSGTLKGKKNQTGFVVLYIFILIVQGIIFFLYGYKAIEMIYPLVTHLPLILFLIFYCRKTLATAITATLAAYLLTSPRHWFGSLTSEFFHNSTVVFYLAQILITVPMLFFICRYVAPSVRSILASDGKGVWLFSSFLIFYYIFTYVMTVFSELLYSGNPAIIEFIDSAIVICYFVFTVLYYHETEHRLKAENDTKILEIKEQQAQVYFEQMAQSNKQIAVYRHDLRHHLQYINTYLESGHITDAQQYIKSICDGVDATMIVDYCENKTVNLLLSHYVDKAKNAGVPCSVKALVTNDLSIPPVDLCVIIANAMENAIHACQTLPATEKPIITVNAYMKNGRLFLEIKNPYNGELRIENNMPVTTRHGHGVGTKSIIMTVEKHNGLWSFEANDGLFVLHVIL